LGRASFGASQDNSGVFSSLYAQYISAQGTLARQGEARTKNENAAADTDAVNRWKSGDMTDEEFRVYAQDRIAASEGLDPDASTYWKEAVRNLDANILSESISIAAEYIQNDIRDGRATWQDLLDYYKAQQSLMEKGNPLYDQITKSIQDVTKQVDQTRINGEFEKVTYDFQNNSITGKEAGKRYRDLAAKYYQTNDPETYYKLLQQATQLEQYGGLYKAGSGGARTSSSGGGSSNASLIDALSNQRDNLRALLDSAKNGAATGSYAYFDANGILREQPITLKNPDGSLAVDVVDQISTVLGQTFDGLITAYTASCQAGKKSDCNNIGATNLAKTIAMNDITYSLLQPENSKQADKVLNENWRALTDAVKAAADGDNPLDAWNTVQQVARSVQHAVEGLNTIYTPAGPEKGVGKFAGKTIGTTPAETTDKPLNEQTTSAEVDKATAMAQASQMIASGQYTTLVNGQPTLDPALVALLQQAGITDTTDLGDLGLAGDIVAGIAEGRRIPVYSWNPSSGKYEIGWQPIVPRQQPIIDPATGTTSYGQGEAIQLADGSVSSKTDLATVLIAENGKITPMYSVPQTSYTGQNPADGTHPAAWWGPITKDQYDAERAKLDTDPTKRQVQPQTVLFMSNFDGTQSTWQMGQNGRWYKNGVPHDTHGQEVDIGGIPVPVIDNGNGTAHDARAAQIVLNQLRDKQGNPLDPSGRAIYDLPGEQLGTQRGAQIAARATNDWYATSQLRDRTDFLQAQRMGISDPTNAGYVSGSPQGGGMDALLARVHQLTSPADTVESGRYAGKKLSDVPSLPQLTPTTPGIPTMPAPNAGSSVTEGRYAGKPLPNPFAGATTPKPPTTSVTAGRYAGKKLPGF
jgi:hypothetical protein